MKISVLALIALVGMSVASSPALADYKRGQGPKGAKGNQCHCNDNSGGMDCVCGISVAPGEVLNGSVKANTPTPKTNTPATSIPGRGTTTTAPAKTIP